MIRDNCAECIKKHQENLDKYINYCIKEGVLDEDIVKDMTCQQKDKIYKMADLFT
jgi:hypothetical protein